MKLKDLMTLEVQTIEAGGTIQDAAEAMARFDVGVLPVTEDEELIGVVTDRDITVRAVAKGVDPKRADVRSIVTPETESAPSETSVEDSIKIMEHKQIRRLLVTDDDGKLGGIISLGDLITRGDDRACVAEALETISQPTSQG